MFFFPFFLFLMDAFSYSTHHHVSINVPKVPCTYRQLVEMHTYSTAFIVGLQRDAARDTYPDLVNDCLLAPASTNKLSARPSTAMKSLMIIHFLAAAAAAVGVSTGTTIRGAILPSQALPNPGDLAPDTAITLTTAGVRLSALLRADNTFVFRNVAQGKSYILDTSCSSHHFAPLRVDVASGDGVVSVKQTFRGNAWSNVGEKRGFPIVCFPSLSLSLHS